MKKIKLLTSLVGLTGLSMGLVPMISGCSCHNKITPELSKDSSGDVKIKESNIVKGQDSTITLTIPQGKEIDTLTITIGNKQLKKGTDFTIDSNNKITIKAEAVTGENVTLTVKTKDKITAKPFAETELSVLISAIETFETSTQDETEMKALCAKFTDTEYITDIDPSITDENKKIEAHLENFIGKTTTIKINNQDHTIRVIGINHDKIADTAGKYAAFTFEIVTLLSGSDGGAMKCQWDLQTNLNYDYTNSILRANLTGQGSGTKSFSSTAISMLPSELQSGIKTVKKHVSTTSTYQLTEYSDTLFPLTYTEMAQSGSPYAKEEGTAYKYWELNESKSTEQEKQQGRKKKDAAETVGDYWLVSPEIEEHKEAWFVSNLGKALIYKVQTSISVSFAFCI